jgi:hypothetical protein
MVARYHVVAELVKNFVIVNSVLDDAHLWPRPVSHTGVSRLWGTHPSRFTGLSVTG